MAFKRRAALSVPQLKLTIDKPAYIKISGPIVEKETNDDKMKSMHLVAVINLETGEDQQLILDRIPYDTFKAFGDKLLGMCFEITKGPKVKGRSEGSAGYYPYTIYAGEFEEPAVKK